MEFESYGSADLAKVLKSLTVREDAVSADTQLDEKISLLSGTDWWTTSSIPRAGIPSVRCSDGPVSIRVDVADQPQNGVRGKSHFKPTPATCIPCATALASTFSPDTLRHVGHLLAEECKAKGASMILGPTVNIQRNPLNGRAFEGFSEDPYLSGTMAGSYIQGLQSKGVGACIKHFVGNDMEHERSSGELSSPESPRRHF